MTPTAARLALLNAGFSPIPVEGKRPPLKEWQKAQANATEIELWERLFPAAKNTGVLTARTPFIDIDLLAPEAAEAIEALARGRFEGRGRLLVRFGRAPKRAIPFRAVVPFKKVAASVIAPDGTEGQKIEVLGLGQQIVVDGIHPETMQPYHWRDSKPGTIKWDDLPLITEAEAREFLDEAVQLLVEKHGYTVGATRPKGKARAGNGARRWRGLELPDREYSPRPRAARLDLYLGCKADRQRYVRGRGGQCSARITAGVRSCAR
jgi:Bifunctional DNA primase/polymerase, N-terminal